MSTALFVCMSDNMAHSLQSELYTAPVHIYDSHALSNSLYVWFDGDCPEMYGYCLEKSLSSHGKISFIGIDEVRTKLLDQYSVIPLSKLPRMRNLRSDTQQKLLYILIEQFMRACVTFDIPDDWLRSVCQCSVIGVDTYDSAGHCFHAVRCCQECGKRMNYIAVCDPYSGSVYSVGDWNTMVRVMAHICYLADSFDNTVLLRLAKHFIDWL